MSTTNPPPGAPIPPGAGPTWPADAANLSAPDDHGGGGGVDPAALKLGHEPDVFEVKPILSIPFAVVVTFVIGFAVAAGVFVFVMAKGRETDPRAHPDGLARGSVPLNERLARISQKGSTTVPSEVDAPRLETLQRLQGNDKVGVQFTTQPPVPTGNSPWIHPEELQPGRYEGLHRSEYLDKDKKWARIPIDDAMKLLIEKKALPAAANGVRPQGVVDQPTNGNGGRGGLPKAPEVKAAPKAPAKAPEPFNTSQVGGPGAPPVRGNDRGDAGPTEQKTKRNAPPVTRRTLLAVALALLAAPRAAAQGAPALQPGEGRAVPNPEVKIDEHVGTQLPLDLVFRNERNEEVTLGQCMNGKPTILVLAYYRCPMNCTDVLNGLVDALRLFPPGFDAGNQFNVVVVSFDPKEQPSLAADKKKFYLAEYGRPGAENGWFFLTGRREPIRQLTEAVGFGYSYDKVFKEYDHPSGVTVVTPTGTIARYFYGIKYDGNYRVPGGTTTLRLSLVEASEGKVGSLLDRLILRCYRFDYQNHKYTPNVMLAVRAGGVLTVLMLAATVVFFKVRERRRAARAHATTADAGPGPGEDATC